MRREGKNSKKNNKRGCSIIRYLRVCTISIYRSIRLRQNICVSLTSFSGWINTYLFHHLLVLTYYSIFSFVKQAVWVLKSKIFAQKIDKLETHWKPIYFLNPSILTVRQKVPKSDFQSEFYVNFFLLIFFMMNMV